MYVLIKNGEINKFPYTPNELFHDNRGIIEFPEGILTDEYFETLGMFRVHDTPKPEFNSLAFRCIPANPIFDEAQNIWLCQWEIIQLAQDEVNQAIASLKAYVVSKTQERLDNFARERGYDGIVSAISYLNSRSQKRRLEAERCLQLRDDAWEYLDQLEQDAEAGVTVPTNAADILALLPALTWAS